MKRPGVLHRNATCFLSRSVELPLNIMGKETKGKGKGKTQAKRLFSAFDFCKGVNVMSFHVGIFVRDVNKSMQIT